MEIVFLPLPPTLRSKLLSAGIRTVADIYHMGPVELAKEAQVSHEEALHILSLVPGNDRNKSVAIDGAKSAWELLAIEKSRKRITTMSCDLDRILGGGITPGEVTEICGVPGIGKTQFGMQLSMSVQIPSELNGLGGEAIYVDTEGSFMVGRAREMAEATISDVWEKAEEEGRIPGGGKGRNMRGFLGEKWNPEGILGGISFFRVKDYVEQIALVNSLPEFLERHPNVRLIVFDSVTFHFRQDFSDMALRTRLLTGMSQKLMEMAANNDCAIVLVNQVTTKISGETSQLVPALGETWSHACTNRVIFFWAEGNRCAHVYKSPSLKNQSALFSVSSQGVRDVEERKRRRTSATT